MAFNDTPEVERYSNLNGGKTLVQFPWIYELCDEYDFSLPQFEELVYDYAASSSPTLYAMTAQEAEHGLWTGYDVTPETLSNGQQAVASEIGVYWSWRSESDLLHEPCYECGIIHSLMAESSGWASIPITTIIAYSHVSVYDNMNDADNAKMAYEALSETLSSLGLM